MIGYRGAATVLPRLVAVLALLILIAAPAVAPPAAAGEPGSVPFLQVRIDRVTPEVVTTTSEPVVTVTGTVLNVGDRPVRDVMVRLEHAAAVTSSAGLRTNLGGENDQFEPVADFITVSAELQRGQNVPFTLTVPLRSADVPSLGVQQPGVYPLLVNANGTPDYGAPARLDDARFLLPVIGVPPERAADSSADALADVVPPDTSKPVGLTRDVAARRPAPAGAGCSRRDNAGAADRRRARRFAGRGRAAGRPVVGGRFRDQPVRRPRRSGAQRAVSGRRSRSVGHRERDDERLRRQRRTRHRPGHADASRRRPGRRGELAESTQGAGPADVRRAGELRPSRPRRPATGGRPGAELHRHQRRRRHRRPDPRHHVDPGRHAGGRRAVDRSRDPIALGAGAHGRARGGQSHCRELGDRRTGDGRRHPDPLHARSRHRPVRPHRRRRTGRCRNRSMVPVVSGPRARHSGPTRFGGGAPPGRVGLAAVAWSCAGDRAAQSDPDAADGLEPAGRRRGGDPDRGGHHDPGRARRATAADRGDRRECRRCRSRTPGRCPTVHPAIRGPASTIP